MKKFRIFVKFRVECIDLRLELGSVLEITGYQDRTEFQREIQRIADDFHERGTFGRQQQPRFGLMDVS